MKIEIFNEENEETSIFAFDYNDIVYLRLCEDINNRAIATLIIGFAKSEIVIENRYEVLVARYDEINSAFMTGTQKTVISHHIGMSRISVDVALVQGLVAIKNNHTYRIEIMLEHKKLNLLGEYTELDYLQKRLGRAISTKSKRQIE